MGIKLGLLVVSISLESIFLMSFFCAKEGRVMENKIVSSVIFFIAAKVLELTEYFNLYLYGKELLFGICSD